MEKNNMEKVVVDTGSIVLKIVYSDDGCGVYERIYPIYPYGNYVEKRIEIRGNEMEYSTLRMSWGGTGKDSHGYVVLSEEEKEEIVKTIKSIRTLEDFDKLIETFIELKKTREEAVERLWDKLESELLELIAEDERVRALNLSQEELKEKVREFIEYLVGE